MDSHTLYYRGTCILFNLVFERHQIEKSQNHIENIVDMMLFYEQMPLKSVPNKKRLMHFAMQV